MQGSAPFSKAPLRAGSKIALGWCVILWATRAATLRGLTGPACASFMFIIGQTSSNQAFFTLYSERRPQSSPPYPTSPNPAAEDSPRSLLLVDPGFIPKRGPKTPRVFCSSDKISTHPATHPNAWGHSEAEQTPLMKWYNFSKLMRRRWPEPTGMNSNGQQAEEISPCFPHKLTEVMLARVWIFLASSSLQLYTWLGLICYLCQLCIFVKFKGLLPWPDLAKSELTCGSLVAISF